VTRNLFYSTLSAGSAVLMLLLLVLAGRWLGPADYGDFMFAIGLATIAEAFMDLGLHQITVRTIARDRSGAGHLLHTSLWLKIAPGVGMVLVFGAAAFVLRAESPVRLACVLMLLSATMRSYLLTARGVLLGLEQFGHDAIVTTLDRAVLLAACGLALWAGASVVQLSLVFLAVRVVSAGGAVWLARRHVGPGRLDMDLWRRLPAEAVPVGLFLLVLNLYNRVDTLMLGAMRGNVDTGLYSAAYPVYEGLTYATAVLSAVLSPRLARLWAQSPPAFASLVKRSLGAAFVLGAVIATAAWPLAGIGIRIFGGSYDAAAETLRWLLLGLPFVYAIWVLHAVAVAAHQTRTLLIVTAMGTLLNVGLNLLLIPRYTYNGSAVATVISEVVAVVLLLYGLRRAINGQAAKADSVSSSAL